MSLPVAPPPLPPRPRGQSTEAGDHAHGAESRASLPKAPPNPSPRPSPRREPAASTSTQPYFRGARKPAIAGMLLGTTMISINLAAMGSGNVFFPKALAVGIAIAHVGLAMFVFPGQVELPMFSTRRIPLPVILEGLEPNERLAWLGATVYGIGLGLLVAVAL